MLVVYGALVWKVAVVVAALGGVALLRWRSRVRERRIVARSLALYGNASSAPLEGVVVLRGHLRGGGVSTSSGDERAGGPLSNAKEAGAWLEVGGDRVELPGEVGVIRGSSAKLTRHGRTFELLDGDEVVALGTCRRRVNEAHYREAGGDWVLAPLPHRPAVEMLAARPAIVVRPIGLLRATLVFAGGLLAGYLAFVLASPILSAVGLGLANPVARDAELRGLEDRAAASDDPAERERAYDYVELRSGCAAAFERLYEDGMLERALETAQRCDLQEGDSRVMIQLGRYAEAGPVDSWSDALFADVAAGRWVAAKSKYRATSVRADCTLVLLAYRAGEPDANLDALASTDPLCERYARHVGLHPQTPFDLAREDLAGIIAVHLDLDPPSGSADAALLAFYRGDFDGAYRIAHAHPDGDALARLIELRSGHLYDRDGLAESLDPALVHSLRVPSFEALFTSIANIDRKQLQQIAPAAHAMTFHPARDADIPGAMIREAALRRDLARYLGDTDHVVFWQRVIDRNLAVLADPDRRNLIESRFGAD